MSFSPELRTVANQVLCTCAMNTYIAYRKVAIRVLMLDEPFDVSPYAHAMFQFCRNPICQEMGRKFKISFLLQTKIPLVELP
jgi:hypothetical protein